MPELNPLDRDRMIRTIWGEAADQGPVGQAAVAHVILNRLKEGSFGKTPTDIVLAPNQFEPWQARPGALARLSPQSEDYQAIGNVVDGVASGNLPDPTGGALNFYAPELQASLGRDKPSWAKGEGLRIGGHVFYNPMKQQQVAQADTQHPQGVTFDEIFAPKKAAPVTQEAPKAEGGVTFDEIFAPKKAAVKTEQAAPSPVIQPPPGAEPGPPISLGDKQINWWEQGYPKSNLVQPDQRTALGKFSDAINAPGDLLESLAGQGVMKSFETSKAGIEGIKSGIAQPNWLPSFTTVPTKVTNLLGEEKPATGIQMTAPGKLLGALGGTIQAGGAPVLGPLQVGQEQLEKLSGNKEFAEKMVAMPSSILGAAKVATAPVKGVAEVSKAALPSSRALENTAKFLAEEKPEAIANLPKDFAPVDVSQNLRQVMNTRGVDRRDPKSAKLIEDFVQQRKEAVPGKIEEAVTALGAPKDAFDSLTNIITRAEKIGEEKLNPFVMASKSANVSSIVNSIDKSINDAKESGTGFRPIHQELAALKQKLGKNPENVNVKDVGDQQGLHWLQAGLRAKAESLMNSADGSSKDLGRDLMDYRNKLVDAIDAANPGYKKILGEYKVEKDVRDAFTYGNQIDKSEGTTEKSILESSPGAWRKYANSLEKKSPFIAEGWRLGILANMARKLNGIKEGTELFKLKDNPAYLEKIEAAFGKESADKFSNIINNAERYSQTASEVGRAGSPTAPRLFDEQVSPLRLANTPDKNSFLNAGVLGAAAYLPAEMISAYLGHPGLGGLIASGATAAKATGTGLSHLFRMGREQTDKMRRFEEARRALTPLAEQPDLLALLKERQRQLSGEKKPSELSSSPLFQLLPR